MEGHVLHTAYMGNSPSVGQSAVEMSIPSSETHFPFPLGVNAPAMHVVDRGAPSSTTY